ncbi:MAG TPA: outer membrane beta-barrel protein [Chthoniobacterales bacterium]|nr:outer membrane beta-barrel protein [Chthoniobacterales bacterium]
MRSFFAITVIFCAVGLAAGIGRAQDVYPGGESAPLTLDGGKPQFVDSVDVAPLPPGQGPAYFDGKASIDPKDDHKASLEINAGDEVSAVPKRFQYAFRLNLRGVYDDNIFITNENRVDDYYFAIEPGVTIGYGDIVGRDQNYIRLDYAPSIFLFVDHSDSDAVQHLIRLEGAYRFGRLTLGLSQDVHLLDGTNLGALGSGVGNSAPGINLDAGGDTSVNIFNTNATFSYDLTGKTFLSGGLHVTASDYDGLIDSSSFSGNFFVNYTYSPKLVIGVGGTGGYNWVESFNPNQTFEQANVRATYQISGKVSLNASAGVEFRQLEESYSTGDNVSPVYEIGAAYQPFDGTSITARGSRRTLNSAVLVGNDYASTNITFGIRQRLLRRIYLGLAAGYENSDYFSTIQFVDGSRHDDYFFVQPAIDVTLTRFWTVGAYFLHRENESSSSAFSFYDNQVGLRTSLTY